MPHQYRRQTRRVNPKRKTTKPKKTKTTKTTKRTSARRRVRGGSLGNQKVRLWVMGYPNHINAEESFSYLESVPTNPKDPLNIDSVETMFNSLIWNIPPRGYQKTVELTKN